ncbi:MAG: hypothetical protein ACLSD6_03330 [Clostridium sp.]
MKLRKARVRVAESKEDFSGCDGRKSETKAKATEPFRFEKALAGDGVSFICEVKRRHRPKV